MKFSIIVPVYNVEKYIEKCLESIKSQIYKEYEVILVNDGSTDKSASIIEKYLNDEKFKLFNKNNGGLSSARNYGVAKSNGEYIIFVDSDDYIDSSLLYKLNETIEKNPADLIRYGVCIDDKTIVKTPHNSFECSKTIDCIFKLLEAQLVEPAWAYCYKASFYKENNFQFEEGRYHEDYGLIPYIILKSKSIISIPFYGYYYVIRDNSIMMTTDINKNEKKIKDTLYLFDVLVKKISEDSTIDEKCKKIMYSFLTNILITRSRVVNDLNSYINELNNRNISKYLLNDTLIRKIKKIIVKINLKLYIRLFVK